MNTDENNAQNNTENNTENTAENTPQTTPAPESRPFGFWIAAVDRLVAAELATAFEDEGITRRDWRILSVIDGTAPFDRAGRGPSDRALRGPKLRRFAELGWIERDDDGWSLTEQGTAAKARLSSALQDIRAQVTATLDDGEFAAMTASLERVARGLGWQEGARLPRSPRRGGAHRPERSGRSGRSQRPDRSHHDHDRFAGHGRFPGHDVPGHDLPGHDDRAPFGRRGSDRRGLRPERFDHERLREGHGRHDFGHERLREGHRRHGFGHGGFAHDAGSEREWPGREALRRRLEQFEAEGRGRTGRGERRHGGRGYRGVPAPHIHIHLHDSAQRG